MIEIGIFPAIEKLIDALRSGRLELYALIEHLSRLGRPCQTVIDAASSVGIAEFLLLRFPPIAETELLYKIERQPLNPWPVRFQNARASIEAVEAHLALLIENPPDPKAPTRVLCVACLDQISRALTLLDLAEIGHL